MPESNLLLRPTRASLGKGRLIAKPPLKRRPWTSISPMAVGIGVARMSEPPVPGPPLRAGTKRKGKLEARPPRLWSLIDLGSQRESLAVRARLPWVKYCSRQVASSPRGQTLGPCQSIPLERSIRSTTARSLACPLLFSSTNRKALTWREPRNNQSRHGTLTRTCRWLPCRDTWKR